MLDSFSSSPHADRISVKVPNEEGFSWRKFLAKRLTAEEVVEIEALVRESVLKRDSLELRFQFNKLRGVPGQYRAHHNTATIVFGEEGDSVLGYKMFFPYQIAGEFNLPDPINLRPVNCVAFANQIYH